MRLQTKTEMCVPYGTEAQVQGSPVASIRLMVRLSEIRTKNKEQRLISIIDLSKNIHDRIIVIIFFCCVDFLFSRMRDSAVIFNHTAR